MPSKNVTNNTASPLGLPTGQIIDPKRTSLVKNWEKIESNNVVKSWLDAGALTLADPTGDGADNSTSDADTGGGNDAGNTPNDEGKQKQSAAFVPKTDDEIGAMTNADLSTYITELGGEVKSTWNKPELVEQVVDLQNKKVAAGAAKA